MSNKISEFPGRKEPTEEEQQKNAIDFSNELIDLANKYVSKLHAKTMVLGLESVKLDLMMGGDK